MLLQGVKSKSSFFPKIKEVFSAGKEVMGLIFERAGVYFLCKKSADDPPLNKKEV